MKLILTTLSGDIYPLEVPPDLTFGDFKQLCASECGISYEELSITLDGKTLTDDSKSLTSFNLKDDDVILVQKRARQLRQSGNPTGGLDFSNIRIPGAGHLTDEAIPFPMDNPARIREMYLSNPEQLNNLRQINPALADALVRGPEEFNRLFNEARRMREEEERRRLRMLRADPFDAEAQRLIQEEINRQNIASNMEAAIEYHPESFGTVHMLFINCKVNGHPVKAFVDSGAQSTIMSQACADRCNTTKLIDTRWSGIAKGVGTQKIKGRIHLCNIQIENDHLPTSFIILEGQEMDMLLGLDMLKRHQCCIDLKDNVLIIGTTGTRTKFLDEKDIPTNSPFHQ